DLEQWTKVAGPSWSYEACLPYFQRLESDHDFPGGLHGTSGPIPVERPPRRTWSRAAAAYEEVCLAVGFPECPDFNRPDASGIGPADEIARAGIDAIADLPGVGRGLRNHPLCATSWSMAPTYGEPEILGIPWQTQLRTTAPGSADREDACLGMAVLGSRLRI